MSDNSFVKEAGDLVEFIAEDTGLLKRAQALAYKVAVVQKLADDYPPGHADYGGVWNSIKHPVETVKKYTHNLGPSGDPPPTPPAEVRRPNSAGEPATHGERGAPIEGQHQ